MGTGTSTGVPSIGCDCEVCRSTDLRNKRLRSGLLLREGDPREGKAVIVDCGPDFREQALRHEIYRLDGVLMTHSHFDHISGLDDLRIYNFRQKQALPLFGQTHTLESIRYHFPYFFNPPKKGGGVASLDMITIEGPFEFLGMRIVPLPAKHGDLDIVGYRFGDFVYMTDANEIPESSLSEMKGCRTLVLNALRHRHHSTHFNLEEAVEAAREVGAERTWFVHMTHDLDHEKTNAELPEGIDLAYDGLEFDFEPEMVDFPEPND